MHCCKQLYNDKNDEKLEQIGKGQNYQHSFVYLLNYQIKRYLWIFKLPKNFVFSL